MGYDFGKAIWGTVLSRMSGPLSVPFTIAALYLTNEWGKALMMILALLCVWVAAFQIWKRERIRVSEAEKKLDAAQSSVSRGGNMAGNIRDIASRDEHTSAIREQTVAFERQRRQEAHERSARQKIADELAVWIKRASPLRDSLQDHDAPPPPGLKLWNSEVAAYVLESMGPVYEVRFVEPATFSDDQLGPLGRNPANMLKLGLQEKINRLYKFIEELK